MANLGFIWSLTLLGTNVINATKKINPHARIAVVGLVSYTKGKNKCAASTTVLKKAMVKVLTFAKLRDLEAFVINFSVIIYKCQNELVRDRMADIF